jgi:hypothetical protein
MAYRSRYTGRYSGIGSMLSRPWLQAPCLAAAEKLKTIAEARSPVGDPRTDPHSGRYKASFSVVPITKNVPFRGKPRRRSGARLVNSSPEAWMVEYGNGDTPRYLVLWKSVEDLKAAHRA